MPNYIPHPTKPALDNGAITFVAERRPPDMDGSTTQPMAEVAEAAESDYDVFSFVKRREPKMIPAPARPALAPGQAPYNADDNLRDRRALLEGTMSFDQYKARFRHLWASEVPAKAALAKVKKDDLMRGRVWIRPPKKDEVIDAVWRDWVRNFYLEPDRESVFTRYKYPRPYKDETLNMALYVESVTPEQFAQNLRDVAAARAAMAAKRAERQRRLDDPQTIEDFTELIRVRGDVLTADQRRRLEELRAAAGLAAVEEKARKISGPAVADQGWSITPTWHFKQNVATWTVQKAERGKTLEREAFVALNDAAKGLGGGWERFTKREGDKQAVAGFLFFTKQAAEKFLTVVQGGTVDNADELARREEYKAESRAERLETLAESRDERADAVLSATRKTNTARRAGIATHIESRARGEKAVAESMRGIAKAIEGGQARYLKWIRHGSDVELLDKLLIQAHYRRRHAERSAGTRPSDQDEGRLSLVDVDFAEYPWPRVNASVLRDAVYEASKTSGAIMVGKNVADRIKGSEAVEFKTEKEIGQLRSLANRLPKMGPRLKSELEEFESLQRMRLTNQPMLREALREYLNCCRGEATKMDPLAAAERALIGKRWDGYFPTPAKLADAVVAKADLRPGQRVLEPSAGKGDLAAAILRREPNVDLAVIEPIGDLREVLKLRGLNIVASNFLTATPEELGTFDRIVMNPPFEKYADVAHVRHAYTFLRPGGRLVAIMGASAWQNEHRVAQEFRAWADEHGEAEQNPEGSFLASDVPTSVRTYTVVLDKPGAAASRRVEALAPAPAPAPAQPTQQAALESQRPADVQPYFFAYLYSQGRPPTSRDANMAPFMAWIQARWAEFRKENGLRRDTYLNDEQHKQFGRWLDAWALRAAAALPPQAAAASPARALPQALPPRLALAPASPTPEPPPSTLAWVQLRWDEFRRATGMPLVSTPTDEQRRQFATWLRAREAAARAQQTTATTAPPRTPPA